MCSNVTSDDIFHNESWHSVSDISPYSTFQYVLITLILDSLQSCWYNTLFRRSWRHLVSGAKPQICSVKVCKVIPLVWDKMMVFLSCVYVILIAGSGWLMKTKVVVWKPICQEIFVNPHGQSLMFCHKSLTVKIDVKYLFIR